MPAKQYTQEELKALLSSASAHDFTVIYDLYAPPLYSILMDMEPDAVRAEKLLHRLFAQLRQRAGSFDPSSTRLFPWMVRQSVQMAMQQGLTTQALSQQLKKYLAPQRLQENKQPV